MNLECVVCFHKTTLEKAKEDIAEAMACLGPDIVVSQIHRPPTGIEIEWQPTNEHLLDFNEKLIDESLVGKIQEEIRLVYSQK